MTKMGIQTSTKLRTYSELIQLPTFEERFKYLELSGRVGEETFGLDRYLNQRFYNSQLWQDIRRKVFVRDHGCDLGIQGREIYGTVFIHHMNPISVDDIVNGSDILLDIEYLISSSDTTHRAIHYGSEGNLILLPKERRKGDTCPWKAF